MFKLYINLLFIVVVLLFAVLSCSKQESEIQLTGDYLGQAPPDTMPELFATGIISDGYNNRDMAIHPDGDKIFYSILLPQRSGVLMQIDRVGGIWQKPSVAPFSGKYSDIEPTFSHDGKRLYFASNRPLKDGDQAKDYDIWYVELCDAGWKEPVNLGEPVNTESNEFYPSLTKDNVLYFTSPHERSEDIFRSRMIGGKFNKPQRLGDAVNSDRGEFNAMIAPDESYLIFSSLGREDGHGGGDMYISFRNDDNSWSEAVNLGQPLNSNKIDYCPALSPDGKYFFFASSRLSNKLTDVQLRTCDDINNMHTSPGNGSDDIYWVDVEILDKYNPGDK